MSSFKTLVVASILAFGAGCSAADDGSTTAEQSSSVEQAMVAITCNYSCSGKGLTSDGASGTCAGGSQGAGSCVDAKENCASGFKLSNCH